MISNESSKNKKGQQKQRNENASKASISNDFGQYLQHSVGVVERLQCLAADWLPVAVPHVVA